MTIIPLFYPRTNGMAWSKSCTVSAIHAGYPLLWKSHLVRMARPHGGSVSQARYICPSSYITAMQSRPWRAARLKRRWSDPVHLTLSSFSFSFSFDRLHVYRYVFTSLWLRVKRWIFTLFLVSCGTRSGSGWVLIKAAAQAVCRDVPLPR